MLVEKTMLELSGMLERGDTSSEEIARAYAGRIGALNPELNAYIHFDENRLLDEARLSDRRRREGKALSHLDGVPVAIKDNISTKGMPTTCGSAILKNYVPPFDATVCEKLKACGCLVLGKTNMDEFAMGSTTETSCYGPAKNPHDRNRVPGGSSGGSAVAVASSMAPAALGSDTGGSIRQPAAFCGVAGIKPTYGRVSRYGLVAYASSLDQIGCFGRTVDDAAALLAIIAGHDDKDSTSIDRPVDFRPEDLQGDVRGMVVGVSEEYFRGTSPVIRERIHATLRGLEDRGARLEPVSLGYVDYAIPVYYLIATAEASSNLARYDGVRYGYRSPDAKSLLEMYQRTRGEGFGKEVKRRIILGTFALSAGYYDAYYLKAMKGRTIIINDFKKAFTKADVIITPVTTTTAFRLGEKTGNPLEMYMSDILTISANLAAIPGMSVPAGTDDGGLPIGLQILGNHFRERTVLCCAKAVEEIYGRSATIL